MLTRKAARIYALILLTLMLAPALVAAVGRAFAHL